MVRGTDTQLTTILDAIAKALQLIFSGDPLVYGATLLSLFISGMATLLAILWGLPFAMVLGLGKFPGRLLVKGFFNALIGVPTVALGLILFLVYSASGPLGPLRLLYTPTAVILGEALLITPLVVSLGATAIEAVDPDVLALAKTLGASESQANFAVLKEALNGIVTAGIASFNRAIAELGVALMVGGNIVLTTRIANEINRPDEGITVSLALTIILLSLVFGINLLVHFARRRRRK